MKLTDHHRAAFDDILKWRRDVRHFRRDPVDPIVLDRLRRSMENAPSVGNARPWRVIQVNSATHRSRIIDIFEACNAQAADTYDSETRRDYLALKLAGLHEAPVQLAVFTDQNVIEGRGLGRKTMPEMLSYSTAIAIHTLWLAARVENIGLGWVSILDPDAVCAALDVPPGWSLTGYLCLGYAETEADTPILHKTGWQKNTPTDWQIV